MLHALWNYANEHNLKYEAGFAAGVSAHWVLDFGPDGDGAATTFRGILRLSTEGQKKGGRTFDFVPRLTGSQVKSTKGTHPLIEGSEKMFDLEDGPGVVFWKTTRMFPHGEDIANAVSTPEVLAKVLSAVEAAGVKKGENLTLSWEGALLINEPEVAGIWRAFYQKNFAEQGGPESTCLVTGKFGPAVRLHPRMALSRWVPGADATGVSLASFNEPAFCSYGATQGLNAPCSEEGALAVAAAIQHIAQRAIRLEEVAILYWYGGSVETNTPDPLAFLGAPTEAEALKSAKDFLLWASKRGTSREGVDPGRRYYMMVVKAEQARLAVRDWHEGSFGDLARNILSWLDALQLETPWGASPTTIKSILWASRARESGAKPEPLPPRTVLGLWNAVLFGAPIPPLLVQSVLQRERVARSRGERPNGTRIALLKAWINREHKGNAVKSTLDENHPSAAYHCGRLLCVLDQIQYLALGRRPATSLSAKHFAAASRTPGVVFGQLLSSVMSRHVSELQSPYWAQMRIASILEKLEGGIFPRVLNLEEQGLFALGFFQEQAASREKANKDGKEEVGEVGESPEGREDLGEAAAE